MSIANHPNFHAVKFATDITVSYHESIRGDAKTQRSHSVDEMVMHRIVKFVDDIETMIDSDLK